MKTFAVALSFCALTGAAPAAAWAADPPPSPPVTFVFEETASLAPAVVVGQTPLGRRQAIPITGGIFSGPGISGRILPGADDQLVRADGGVVIDADYLPVTHGRLGLFVSLVSLVSLVFR